jgi:nicotinate-nucleotide adenylyltransferase
VSGPGDAGSDGRALPDAGGAGGRTASIVPGRTGILGGTFDPVHVGHLAIAEEAREALGMERVLFVPAAAPPHKPDRRLAPVAARVAMVAAAIAGNPAFTLSTVEVDRPGPSFAVDTVAILAAAARAEGRDPDLWWILSSEAFAAIGTWREPGRLIAACRMAVVPRAGAPRPTAAWIEACLPGSGDRVAVVDGPELGVSSSLIRERLAAGRSVRYLVPDAVRAYIDDRRLYAAPTTHPESRTPRP